MTAMPVSRVANTISESAVNSRCAERVGVASSSKSADGATCAVASGMAASSAQIQTILAKAVCTWL